MPDNQRRAKTDRDRLEREAATAGREDLMEAMIAACAIIAYADGALADVERRRVMQLMRALPEFRGFSRDAVAEEFASHERAFAYDPVAARQKALVALETLRPHVQQTRILLSACMQVLEADGIHHPLEYAALNMIGKALDAA
jgi:tellurite resistance protein TerB